MEEIGWSRARSEAKDKREHSWASLAQHDLLQWSPGVSAKAHNPQECFTNKTKDTTSGHLSTGVRGEGGARQEEEEGPASHEPGSRLRPRPVRRQPPPGTFWCLHSAHLELGKDYMQAKKRPQALEH